jgi:hypothetical protein
VEGVFIEMFRKIYAIIGALIGGGLGIAALASASDLAARLSAN